MGRHPFGLLLLPVAHAALLTGAAAPPRATVLAPIQMCSSKPPPTVLPGHGDVIPAAVDDATLKAELEALATSLENNNSTAAVEYRAALKTLQIGGVAAVAAAASANPLAASALAAGTLVSTDVSRRSQQRIRAKHEASIAAAEAKERKALDAADAARAEASHYRSVYNRCMSELFYLQKAAARAEESLETHHHKGAVGRVVGANRDAVTTATASTAADATAADAEEQQRHPRVGRLSRLLGSVRRLAGRVRRALDTDHAPGEDEVCTSGLTLGGRVTECLAFVGVTDSLVAATAQAKRAAASELAFEAEAALLAAEEMEAAVARVAALGARAHAVVVQRRELLARQEALWAATHADARRVGEAVGGLSLAVGGACGEVVASLLDAASESMAITSGGDAALPQEGRRGGRGAGVQMRAAPSARPPA